ncbi:MAG: putative glycoside hydrolase [Candidatus Helarchaeota archaeon]
MNKKILTGILISVIILVSGCINQSYTAPNEGISDHPEDHKESKNVYIATRIPVKTDAQIDFVNSHYDYVMTSVLNTELREKIQGPKLLLYRSIQGTWTDFNHFNWKHIDSNENMFCHHNGNRIKTIWNSWLMNGSDLVDRDAPDALNHWINYYAITASEQVHEYNYDGLFIDSAGHRLWSGAVYNLMPDDYSDKNWREGRYRALEFIKSYFPDKIVVFNGLHTGNGAEHSLTLTDGGMWETFAFRPSNSKYYGEEKWREVIELVERNKEEKLISIVSKKKHLIEDIQSRMFILTSYLLVSNQNVLLTMIDLDYDQLETIYYYPEYEIDLGNPLGSYTVRKNGVYERKFERGIVLVNPSDTKSCTYYLGRKYNEVIPIGGGVLREDGICNGSLSYESVNNEIILSPMSGVVLLKEIG